MTPPPGFSRARTGADSPKSPVSVGTRSETGGLTSGTAKRRRALDHRCFDLTVAIRAHEDALLRFRSVGTDRLSARDADRERLRSWIDVMEMEIDDAAVIAADGATTSSFVDEESLDLLQSASHGLADTPLAPPAAPSVAVGERANSVSPCRAHVRCSTGHLRAAEGGRPSLGTSGVGGGVLFTILRTHARRTIGLPRMFEIVDYTRPGGVARRSGSRLLICRSRFDSERPHFSPRSAAKNAKRRRQAARARPGSRRTPSKTSRARLAAGPHRLAVKVTALSRL